MDVRRVLPVQPQRVPHPRLEHLGKGFRVFQDERRTVALVLFPTIDPRVIITGTTQGKPSNRWM